ncbi:unnamed protein product [Spirodela intermedia]|uniref:Uncharacterized protein n=1 Tax=Spirodela intermedia TaxID=51605 RepID=A0A7I8IC89_SPIIN|nr:unnamed protein product [Spirodela intermedia]CAA6655376.1 unnamed protein product [Spirodela intermedia]
MHGGMINIFSSSAGMAGTKMLTDRPHRDGFVSGNRPYMPKSVVDDPVSAPTDDKPSVSYDPTGSLPARRSGGTPMKMLIAHEMSKETENKQKPPGVVARLMGLDALPAQQPAASPHNIHLPQMRRESLVRGQQEKSAQQDVCKDVYEVWPQQPQPSYCRDQQLPLPSEKRMDLVRQKFMEAKRLATDQRLLQSKEFQDALEVLSSNRDLFLKFLEEPNSLFSHHLQELQGSPEAMAAPQTKRITVLKPSKSVEAENGKDNPRRHHHQVAEDDQSEKKRVGRGSGFVQPKVESLPQPTRIVVLKPSPRKPQDPPNPATGFADGRGILLKGDVAKEITRQMRESLSGNRRDDTLLSSVLSNGYIGDESSFNRSDNEFIEDDPGNFSDLEMVFGSPFSLSSVSRASYSPESSVIREAKKRLSERWAMVASGGSSSRDQQRQVRRSSSTLGEMLAIPEKKEECDGGFAVSSSRSCGGDRDARLLVPSLSTADNEIESDRAESPRKLLRSKSVPASFSTFDNGGPLLKIPPPKSRNPLLQKISTGPRVGRPSSRVKSRACSSPGVRSRTERKPIHFPRPALPPGLREAPVPTGLTCRGSSLAPSGNGAKRAASNSKAGSSQTKVARTAEITGEQPSPVSILEVSFEDEANSSSSQSSEGGASNLDCRQMISRSPPIESVARSLSHSQPKLARNSSMAEECQEHYSFVKSLLSSAGLGGEAPPAAAAHWRGGIRWRAPGPFLTGQVLGEEGRGRQVQGEEQAAAAAAKNGGARWAGGSVAEEVWRRVKGWWSVGGEQCPVALGGDDVLGGGRSWEGDWRRIAGGPCWGSSRRPPDSSEAMNHSPPVSLFLSLRRTQRL